MAELCKAMVVHTTVLILVVFILTKKTLHERDQRFKIGACGYDHIHSKWLLTLNARANKLIHSL